MANYDCKENEGEKLGDKLRTATKKVQDQQNTKREADRKRREEPFIHQAKEFLMTLPMNLQEAAEQGQDYKSLNFLDITAELKDLFDDLEQQLREQHAMDIICSSRKLAEDTFHFCRNAGGLKLIEEYCRKNTITCEPILDIQGTKSAVIRIKFSWPAESQNEPEPRD